VRRVVSLDGHDWNVYTHSGIRNLGGRPRGTVGSRVMQQVVAASTAVLATATLGQYRSKSAPADVRWESTELPHTAESSLPVQGDSASGPATDTFPRERVSYREPLREGESIMAGTPVREPALLARKPRLASEFDLGQDRQILIEKLHRLSLRAEDLGTCKVASQMIAAKYQT
jgi:hypothetical protein